MRMKTAAAGMLALILAGCGGGEVYPLSASRVEARLHSMTLPAELGFGPSGASDASIESSTASEVSWRISERGSTLGWLQAKLEPVDLEHTRVDVDFRWADTSGGAHEGQQKFLSAVGRAALAEAIDAELDGRAYNKGRVQAQVAAYALTHREEMAAFRADLPELEQDMAGAQVRDRIAAASASNPELGVAVHQYETERSMQAASAPSLNLDGDRDD